MKKIFWVLFFSFTSFVVFSRLSVGENCEDTFGWMATSTTSPNDTACRTWSQQTDTPYEWETVYDSATGAEFYLQSPPIKSHNPLAVGGGLGPEFPVSNMTLIEFLLSWSLETKRDGFIIQVSTDGGANWGEVTGRGITLGLPYNYCMSTSTSLDPPPLGLRGIPAYSGAVTKARIRLDPRASTILGQNAIFRLYFASDSSVGVEGVHLYSFNYWNAPLDPPTEVKGVADNTSYWVNYGLTEDPRVSETQVLDNGVPLSNPSSPLQVTGVDNGLPHEIIVRNIDLYGNEAALGCDPFPMFPSCDGEPPMTLLLMSDTGGYWEPQTAEVPCGSGTGPVDGYFVYRSAWVNGPWDLIGTGAEITEFFDSDPIPTTGLWFYRVRTIKSGIMEPEIPGGENPPT